MYQGLPAKSTGPLNFVKSGGGAGTINYLVGDHVVVGGQFYVCIANNTGTTSPATDTTGWAPEASTITIPIDGWGNPILFVPSGGLTKVALTATNGAATTITSPDNRPFWASAGPDGNVGSSLTTYADDNLYSFDK